MNDNDYGHRLELAIGREVAYWRRARGLTRDQLGQAVGLSGTTIGRFERGDSSPDVSETWAIARALNVELSEMLRRAEDAIATEQRGAKVTPLRPRTSPQPPNLDYLIGEKSIAEPVRQDQEHDGDDDYYDETP